MPCKLAADFPTWLPTCILEHPSRFKSRDVEAVGNKVDALERSIKDVETVTARNTFELQLIKGKA